MVRRLFDDEDLLFAVEDRIAVLATRRAPTGVSTQRFAEGLRSCVETIPHDRRLTRLIALNDRSRTSGSTPGGASGSADSRASGTRLVCTAGGSVAGVCAGAQERMNPVSSQRVFAMLGMLSSNQRLGGRCLPHRERRWALQ